MENEENKIKEAQVSEVEKVEEAVVAAGDSAEISAGASKVKKRKRDFYVELALFFILGILIGIAVKTEAVKRITIGFEDYKMKIEKQDYNINQIQNDLAKKQAEEAQNAEGVIPGDENQVGGDTGDQGNN